MRTKVEYRQASKQTYDRFCEANPTITLSYWDYQNIVYTFNYNFRDYILESGNKAKLPWGLGDFAISKRKRRKMKTLPDGTEVITLAIDWKKTKELGKKIYHLNNHTEGYNFKWKWFNKSARFYESCIWNFKPARTTSRLLTHYLNQEGYHLKYKEWDLVR
jgi:hypothetical protein